MPRVRVQSLRVLAILLVYVDIRITSKGVNPIERVGCNRLQPGECLPRTRVAIRTIESAWTDGLRTAATRSEGEMAKLGEVDFVALDVAYTMRRKLHEQRPAVS